MWCLKQRCVFNDEQRIRLVLSRLVPACFSLFSLIEYYSIIQNQPCYSVQLYQPNALCWRRRWPSRHVELLCSAICVCRLRLKTDRMDHVPSEAVYRFILTVFVFSGKYGNGTGCIGTGIKNGWRLFRPYMRYTVFVRDNPVFILFLI